MQFKHKKCAFRLGLCDNIRFEDRVSNAQAGEAKNTLTGKANRRTIHYSEVAEPPLLSRSMTLIVLLPRFNDPSLNLPDCTPTPLINNAQAV